MVKAKKWTLIKVFEGEPKLSDFKLEEEELSDTLKEGEILMEASHLSVDPYMRSFEATPHGEKPLRDGMTMPGQQVGKVMASKSEKFPVGSQVLSYAGWRTHTILPESKVLSCIPTLPFPPSAALGVLGMPGAAAYFGLLEICQPQAGEVVLVNAAAGAVGSIVGQIAKIRGCTVIGFVGNEEKCEWLREMDFDFAFNRRVDDVDESLKKAAPDGIDVFFDNVGGEFTSKVFPHMKQFGRVALCGSISTCNSKEPIIPSPFSHILSKQLKVEGFIVTRWSSRWVEAFCEIMPGLQQGKLLNRETLTRGFENMPEAFLSLFSGDNIGKAIVKI